MPLISSVIPNLINGVSQQPPALRLASQAESVVNCMPSPVEGLKKRPPMEHLARLFTGSAGTNRPFTTIVDRDGNYYDFNEYNQSKSEEVTEGKDDFFEGEDKLGFLQVISSPLTRSSYHAGEVKKLMMSHPR